MNSPIARVRRNCFKLKFNKDLYSAALFNGVLKKEATFSMKQKTDNAYTYITISGCSKKKVLEWLNYVFYLNRVTVTCGKA